MDEKKLFELGDERGGKGSDNNLYARNESPRPIGSSVRQASGRRCKGRKEMSERAPFRGAKVDLF